MNTRLLRMEFGLLLRDVKTRWAILALALLLSVTFATACREAYLSAQEIQVISTKERERWLTQDRKNPHSAAHYGIWAFKSPTSLSALDPGVGPYVGRMVRVEAHRYNDAIYRPAQDASPLGRSGLSTVAQVLQTIVPLACLLLALSVVAADRERGTLRLALGNGAKGATLLGTRSLALVAMAVACTAVPAAVLGLIATVILGSEWAATWPRLTVWSATHAAQATVFVMLGVVISALSRTTRAALAASLFVWVALCVIGPRLVNAYVEKALPVPSYYAARTRAEAEIKRYNAGELHQSRENAFREKQRASEGPAHFDVRGAMLHDREQHDYHVFDREIGGFEQSLKRQDELFSRLTLLSPTLATQALSSIATGADLSHHARFLAAVETYRRSLSDSMNLDLRAHPSAAGKPYLAGAELWSKVPPFQHRLSSLRDALEQAGQAVLALALWFVLAGGGLLLVSRRLKP